MSQTVEMHIIARIRSDFPTKFGIPRQSGLEMCIRDSAEVARQTLIAGKRQHAACSAHPSGTDDHGAVMQLSLIHIYPCLPLPSFVW